LKISPPSTVTTTALRVKVASATGASVGFEVASPFCVYLAVVCLNGETTKVDLVGVDLRIRTDVLRPYEKAIHV
jgi:hypothetical protein